MPLNYLSHTGCTIVRLVLMEYPDPVTKTDPQCKFLSFPPHSFQLLKSARGEYHTLDNRHSRDGCGHHRRKSHRHVPFL